MAIDNAGLGDSITTATEQQNKPLASADPTLRDDHDPIRKTPFLKPAASTTIPPAPTLTSDQATKHTELLESVRAWASKENLSEHEQCWLSRECLLRYLRASSWNVATARKRLEATVAWRRSYGVDSKLTPEYISIENETGKQWIIGYDEAGRPCLYLNPQHQNTARTDRQIQHLVFMLERCVDLAPPGQESLAILMNFAETRTGQGASIAQGRETINILQNHYPERLGRAIIVNRMRSDIMLNYLADFMTVPWHISAFMKLISPFMDPVTKAKIIINEPMADHVPPEQLPTSHGGTLQFKYEHDVYWPALTQSAARRREDQFERWIKGGKHIGELEAYLKGGMDFGISGKDSGKDEKTDGENTKKDTQTTAKVEQGTTVEVDDMTETVVERDGETFEDAVEAVEKLTI